MAAPDKSRIAQLSLLVVAAIWGGAFVAQRTAMLTIGPFLFNGVRFLLAACVLWLLSRTLTDRSFFSRGHWAAGWRVGVVLFASASLQQIGVISTTAGKAGFITGLYILVVPIILFLWRHRSATFHEWIGVAAALSGLYLLSMHGPLTIAPGDSWVLLCAVGFGLHVVMVGEYVRSVDPYALAFWQFLITGAASIAVAISTEPISVTTITGTWQEILYAGILSAGVGYTVQSVAQQRTSSVVAGIILSLESVFAVAAGWLILAEELSSRQMTGCTLMLLGTLIAQIPEKQSIAAKG